MTVSLRVLAREARAAFDDPVRRTLTLESFAKTETEGAADIARAAALVTDPALAAHLRRHAADEARHGRMFLELAAEARAGAPANAFEGTPDLRPIAPLSRGAERDLHGFSPADLVEERGEIAYVAMLHVAELRAQRVFHTLRAALAHDEAVARALDAALRDEAYHVAWTRRCLDEARARGLSREVRRGLALARGARLGGAFARTCARAADRAGRALLAVFYFTVLPLFALATKAAGDGRRRPGPRRTPLERLREQI
jgi:hypothetical protein